tara:strand:- start:25 stop:405 length:381 start_codon:yes stop_codon:yes gene_type:complete
MLELVITEKKKFTPGHYLIFTCADNDFISNNWRKNLKNTDIIIYYYGNDKESYKKYLSLSTYVIQRNSSNFRENFFHFKERNKILFNHYKYIILVDNKKKVNAETIQNIIKRSVVQRLQNKVIIHR